MHVSLNIAKTQDWNYYCKKCDFSFKILNAKEGRIEIDSEDAQKLLKAVSVYFESPRDVYGMDYENRELFWALNDAYEEYKKRR
jgi:hypothetical protein